VLTELLERMARAIERGHHPRQHRPETLHIAIRATMTDIEANAGQPRYVAKPEKQPARRRAGQAAKTVKRRGQKG
jgi:hypothetical protein